MSNQVYTQGSGTASTDLFVTVLSPVDPSPSLNYPPGKRWVNTTTQTEWITTSPGVWIQLGGGSSVAEKLQGNSGGQVGPTNNTIFVQGDGDTINIIGNPSTNTLTASVVSPLNVINGGTGDVSFIPYSLVAGGITSQDALQSLASVGTSGQYLQSQGANNLPIWASPPGFTTTINTIIYSTPGTYSYTPSANCYLIYVQVIGGGGAGGGTGVFGENLSFGSGGAAGAYINGFISSPTAQSVTVGAGAPRSLNAGASGGQSSFGTLLTANGGNGGLTVEVTSLYNCVQGGAGVSGTSGQFISFSAGGGAAFGHVENNNNENIAVSGAGGSTIYGSGGNSVITNTLGTTFSGLDGQGYGSGGSGAISSYNATGSAESGAGADGAVIIVEFIA